MALCRPWRLNFYILERMDYLGKLDYVFWLPVLLWVALYFWFWRFSYPLFMHKMVKKGQRWAYVSGSSAEIHSRKAKLRLLNFVFSLVASVALNYLHAQRERQRVTDTFGHYIDPAVRDQLLSKGAEALELGGRTCEIAVLFVDVRGFTAMSEALDAQNVVEIVNRYLTLTTDCIMKNHGTLDKFVGDCTMAIWNAPVEQDDPVYLACQAAVDMVAGSEALGKELMERYGRTVSFGIGVHYGPAVVGNIGAPKRRDYTAIGDTVNTAARLEANAPGGTILISRAVADILGDRAECTSLGDSIRLKGKAEGFEVIRLDRLHG